MQDAEKRLQEILERADSMSVSRGSVVHLPTVGLLCSATGMSSTGGGTAASTGTKRRYVVSLGCLAVLTLGLAYLSGLTTHHGFSKAWFMIHWQDPHSAGQRCTIPMPDQLTKAFRPPVDCSMCQTVDQVDKVSSIVPTQFEQKYAYSGRPVVVTDAQAQWSARHVFSFDFFKSLYEKPTEASCQFFPYQTEFTHLSHVFNMSQARASMQDGTPPWYVGWSNCDDTVARVLRRHYGRPYFLPATAEGKAVDWIFMGSPGYGAHMHVDNVQYPSWQAQLTGRKLWILQPPPECLYKCNNHVEVVVEPGEIIVMDTNRWYHQTVIVSDDISITIGAEFD